MEFNTEIFSLFDKKWALLTAGSIEKHNTMTISWGGLGTIWNKPVATVYVRKSRYTHEFMDDNEYFTISFYPETFKNRLSILGSVSGRDEDKIKRACITPVKAGKSVSFKEAEVTLVCKKLFKQELSPENIPEDIVKSMYLDNDFHDMYIGEVVDII